MDRKTEPVWAMWRRDKSLPLFRLELRMPGSLAISAIIVSLKVWKYKF
jgi:hypothetical protein